MKQRLILSLVCLMASIGLTFAQTSVKGIVVSADDNEPIIGASVLIKGSSKGVTTDFDGNFQITVPADANTLVVSYIGMRTQEVAVTGNFIQVALQNESKVLDEVVVTALGIQKKEKSLTYSTQIVRGDELTRVKDPNMMNALAGKTAGVQINKSAGGLGGSAKVIIRGNRSVSGNNQPLYVIDGVPYPSSAKSTTGTTVGGDLDGATLDMGDGISNLNPDDIESMNILKGPAAAALYGSSAANGVVIITTKKGKVGRTSISFSSSTTFDQAAYGIPDFQDDYTGPATSWGEKASKAYDNVDDFFKTGVTTINSISLSAGSELMQTYFSYANTVGTGTVEGNRLVKHNFNFRETGSFLNNKLTVDANINAIYQKGNNRTNAGGYYMNPLVGLYHFPRGVDISQYKDDYAVLDASRNMLTQNWYTTSEYEQNPWWLINKTPNQDERYRGTFNLSLKYKFNDQFSLQARGSADFVRDYSDIKYYAGTSAVLVGANGRYNQTQSHSLNTYGDILLTYQQTFGDLAVNASVGTSISDYYGKGTRFDNGSSCTLVIPNVFTLANMPLNSGVVEDWASHTQSQSVFFTGQIGYKDQLFLDLTARNDWASGLAFTDYKNKGFFYPSVGLTWVLNETLKLPEWVTMGKVRAAWSQVGNGLGSYISNPLNWVNPTGTIGFNGTAPFADLKPEKTTSIEFGTEWHFFNNRLDLDITYYKTNTKNQLFTLPAPSGSEWNYYYINAGNIENKGLEVVLGATPILTNNFRWKTSFNFATNKNEAKELAEGLNRFTFNGGESNTIASYLEVGGSFGDLYGATFVRDEAGNITYDENGLPNVDKSDFQKIGNANPDFNLGWSNTFTYKDFSLSFLIDGRFGGEAISITEMDLDAQGVSKTTGDARNRGYVELEGHKINDVEGFYRLVGGRAGVTEYYVKSATNIRLRELSLSYELPRKLFYNTVVKGLSLSLIARNLFFFKNNASYDPDGMLSTGNSLQGIDVFGMPTNRSYGVNLKVNF